MDINDFFKHSDNIFSTNKKTEGLYTEKLKLELGNKYLVRFVPYIKEGPNGYNKTSFTQHTYAWRDINNGRWVYVQSPRTWNENCPISEFYFKANENSSESVKAKLAKLSYRRNTYYNVYVVDDPVHPENNGKVKILQAGAQITDIIKAATSTDPAVVENYKEEYGIDNMRNAMFDLTDKGINFEISVDAQGNFSSYKQSKFVRRRKDLGLTEDMLEKIYESCFDLTTVDKRYTYDEALDIFNKTFLGKSSQPVTYRNEIKDDTSKFVSKPKVEEKFSSIEEDIEEVPDEEIPDELGMDDLEAQLKMMDNE